MINILFFIEELSGGGAEKVLCNLVNEMDQSQFNITVQTLWRTDPARYLKPGIRYRYCYGERSGLNRFRSRLEIAAGLSYPLRLRDNYDIEVAYLEFGATKLMARSTNRKARKIAWVHSDLARKLDGKPKTLRKLARQYAAYDRIVCVSQTAKDSFIRLFGRENDVAVLYNTVDDAAIREKALAFPPDFPKKRRLTVATVGRLSAEKGFDLLLRVHNRLLNCGVAHDLWIIGEGKERNHLETIIAENRLSDSVRLCGYQANPYPYMHSADLLVCSSRYEGLSTFITEGLILGRPIVTTNVSGMQELLGDSEYGLIVENDEDALLEGMRRMLSDEACRADYEEAARERGHAFSAQKLTECTERLFRKELERT